MKALFYIPICIALLFCGCAGWQGDPKSKTLAIDPEGSVPAQESAYGLKRKIAIGRFTNDTRLASSFLTEGADLGASLSRAANDILSSKLAKSGHFLLIERHDTMSIENERSISNIEAYNIPADYLILGSITDFGRKTSGNVGLIDRSKKQTAYAKVFLRIVDSHTGLVIFGEEGSGEAYSETGTVLGMGSRAGYDDTLTDKAIDAAISSVIQNLINRLSKDVWKSYPLSFEDNILYFAGGALQGIKVGDHFFVYRKGKNVLNPQTGIPIDLPGQKIATVEVISMVDGSELTELSIARVIEGEIEADELNNLYISDK